MPKITGSIRPANKTVLLKAAASKRNGMQLLTFSKITDTIIKES